MPPFQYSMTNTFDSHFDVWQRYVNEVDSVAELLPSFDSLHI